MSLWVRKVEATTMSWVADEVVEGEYDEIDENRTVVRGFYGRCYV